MGYTVEQLVVLLQQEDPGSESQPGVRLVCMFSLCMNEFALSTPASYTSPKQSWAVRFIGYLKLSQSVSVWVHVFLSCVCL